MKNQFVVRVALFLIMGVVLGLSPIFSIQTSAVTNPSITITNVVAGDAHASGGKIAETCKSINNDLKDDYGWESDFLTYSYDATAVSCTVTVNMSKYKKLSNQVKQDTMQVALDGIYNSDISRTAKNKLYNEICALDETTSALVRELSTDVTADYAKAYSWFKPFSGWVGWILGVLCLAIFVLIGLTLVVDIAYITIPIVQLWLTAKDDSKAKFVSVEAFSAVKEQYSKAGQTHVSAMGVYLRLKTKQFVALFICLLYLMSGKIYVLLASIMDYFRGVLG